MARHRLTHAARADIVAILAWSHDWFGQEARKLYEALADRHRDSRHGHQ